MASRSTALLGRDKCYAVEEPGYGKIARIYGVNQVALEYIGVDDKGLDIAALRRKEADVVHISPSHHYPTGIVMPIGRRHELLRWAAQKPGRYILEDDYDSEFRFVGRPIPTLYSADENRRVIYINTFSKTIAPSIRISYMVLPPRCSPRAAACSRSRASERAVGRVMRKCSPASCSVILAPRPLFSMVSITASRFW